MRPRTLALCAGMLALFGSSASCAPSHIELVSIGRLSATARDDLAVLPQVLEDGTPHNLLGGLGSGIAYTGVGTRYLAAPDRGPGASSSFVARFHVLDAPIGGSRSFPIRRVATFPLSDEQGSALVGTSSAFDRDDPRHARRRDIEAIRVSPRGTIYVADEYGPSVEEFDARGRRLRSFAIPAKFLIAHPSASAKEELPPHNQQGRMPKLSMEGLALSPDGQKLYALMQSPLLQDHALAAHKSDRGRATRLLEIDVVTGYSREFVYLLEDARHGTNEIVAVNAHQFLVIERDWEQDNWKAFKRIFKIDLLDATDVSDIASLPASDLPSYVRPVQKELFIDLRARAFNPGLPRCPEKIEGLAFGPDLPDGRHLLLVSCDNDFSDHVDSAFLAFAVAPAALPDYVAPELQPDGVLSDDSTDGTAHRAATLSVLSTALFDATDVPATALRVHCADAKGYAPVNDCSAVDVNGDGLGDLRCRLTAPCGAPTADQVGALFEGKLASGSMMRSHASLPRDSSAHHATAR